jgi:3-methyl-2-oxobutanoate hydroxymethyltransferase
LFAIKPMTNPAPESAHAKALQFRNRKADGGLVVLTAYDFPTARLLDEAGADALLVGDSLGMMVLGFPDTTEVTLAHMLHHVAAVARVRPQALIVGDMPIHTYDTPDQALETAHALVAAGADAVKLEGGVRQEEKVRAITTAGIPVMGHLGMLPQRVREEGGYHRKGKTPEQADALVDGAQALVRAGVFAIVLESVVAEAAKRLTSEIPVPMIGIGCGGCPCDGEVAVIQDVLGSFPWFLPPFAKPEADLAGETRAAVARHIARIRANAADCNR